MINICPHNYIFVRWSKNLKSLNHSMSLIEIIWIIFSCHQNLFLIHFLKHLVIRKFNQCLPLYLQIFPPHSLFEIKVIHILKHSITILCFLKLFLQYHLECLSNIQFLVSVISLIQLSNHMLKVKLLLLVIRGLCKDKLIKKIKLLH